MMTLSRGIRGDAGPPLQTAAGAAPPARIVTAMSAVLWAGPAAPASNGAASVCPSSAPLIYPAVPPGQSQRRAPPDRNHRQATELTPRKDRTRYACR
jgi:hypothetical protein